MQDGGGRGRMRVSQESLPPPFQRLSCTRAWGCLAPRLSVSCSRRRGILYGARNTHFCRTVAHPHTRASAFLPYCRYILPSANSAVHPCFRLLSQVGRGSLVGSLRGPLACLCLHRSSLGIGLHRKQVGDGRRQKSRKPRTHH